MLTIYGVPLSVHTRKALMTAMHKNLDHKFEVVIPVIPDNPPANWPTLSPTGLIPALQDGEFTLADSTAICLYLERKHPTAPLLPADNQMCGRALWFDAYAGGTMFRQIVHPLFHQIVVAPRIRKIATDRAIVDTALSLADLAVASNLLTYRYLGCSIPADQYPKLSRYLADVLELDVFRRAIAQERPFVDQMGLDRGFLN